MATYRRSAAAAPAGAAAYETDSPHTARRLRQELKQTASQVGSLTKHASEAGLLGAAEAAGFVLGGLTSPSRWRQELMQIRVAAGLALTALLGYVLFFAPRELGFWGEAALVLHGCSDNALSFVLFNMLGIVPAMLGCVIWPMLRNNSYQARPLWPYIAASFGTGTFALLSYMTRWDPPKNPEPLPFRKLEGRTVGLQRAYESRIFPATLLASSLYLYTLVAVATPATWAHFGYLLNHSMTVNVMMIDFSMLVLLSGWLVVRDATARGWGLVNIPAAKWALGLAMVLTPGIGPGVYLLLRPISDQGLRVRPAWNRAKVWFRELQSYGRVVGQHAVIGGRELGREAAAQGGRAVAAAERAARRAAPHAAAAAGQARDSAARGAGWAAGQAAAAAHRAAPHAAAAAAQARDAAAYGAGYAAGGTAAAGDVAAAAAVPLPGALSSAAQTAGVAMRQGWDRSWMWVGQNVARFRGGGAAVAESDEAAGHELDVNDYDAQEPQSPSLRFWQKQTPTDLGPGPSPVKAKSPDGGVELLFADDYDEYDADTTDTDVSTEELTDDDDIDEEDDM